MAEVEEKVRAEFEKIERALGELELAKKRPKNDRIVLVAMGAYILNIYNGMENILKQLINHKRAPLPKSAEWHSELLTTSVKNGFITKVTAKEINELMTFRHFFAHSYGFLLDEEKLRPLVKSAPAMYARFKKDVEKYLKKIK